MRQQTNRTPCRRSTAYRARCVQQFGKSRTGYVQEFSMQPSLLRIRVWSAEDLLLAVLDRGAECNVTPTKRKAQEQAMRQRSHGCCCSRSSRTICEPLILVLNVSPCPFVWCESSGEAVQELYSQSTFIRCIRAFWWCRVVGQGFEAGQTMVERDSAQQNRMRAVDVI